MQQFRRPFMMRSFSLLGLLLVFLYSFALVSAPIAAVAAEPAPVMDCHQQSHSDVPTQNDSTPACCATLACCHVIPTASLLLSVSLLVQPVQLTSADPIFVLQGISTPLERPPRA